MVKNELTIRRQSVTRLVAPLVGAICSLPASADGLVQVNNPARLAGDPTAIGDTEQHDLLRAACRQGRVERDAGGEWVCTVCPHYTAQRGDGASYRVNALLRGQLTTAGADEAVLDMDGCEPHVRNSGGAILLGRTEQGRWVRRGYPADVRPDDCLVFPHPGSPDTLLCNETYRSQGETVGILSTIRPSEQGFSKSPLLRWYDNAPALDSAVTRLIPLSWTRRDLNGDGEDDLVVELSSNRYTLPGGMTDVDEAIRAGFKPPTATLRRVEFFGADNGFRVSDGTKRALADFEGEVRRATEGSRLRAWLDRWQQKILKKN